MNNTYLYIVDDEDSIRNALERGLRRWARDAGMTIQTFGTPKEILEALRMNAGSVRIIISDLRMPHMDGLALLKTINEEHPTIPGILLTGNIDIDSIVSTNPPGVFSIVEKPWEHEALIKILEKAIQHRAERT
jgi:two-component system nitrogen regulation response regulator GlnG